VVSYQHANPHIDENERDNDSEKGDMDMKYDVYNNGDPQEYQDDTPKESRKNKAHFHWFSLPMVWI